MDCMSVLSIAVCSLEANFPFPCLAPQRDSIPPQFRRRSSQTMQFAFTAATAACQQANITPDSLSSIFASIAGEIQITDQLCTELAKPDGFISPNAFSVSVQNTVAAYWSIAQHCTQATTALAAGVDSFAMALQEAWCQLYCHSGSVLLVYYDESCPNYLTSEQIPFACALVLSSGKVDSSLCCLEQPLLAPQSTTTLESLNVIPLLTALHQPKPASTISIGLNWQITIKTPCSTY